MKFSKNFLLDLLEDEATDAKIISTEFYSKGRWRDTYCTIFQWQDRFFKTYFDKPSTENCDGDPYEFDGPEIECKEVFAKQKLVTFYE